MKFIQSSSSSSSPPSSWIRPRLVCSVLLKSMLVLRLYLWASYFSAFGGCVLKFSSEFVCLSIRRKWCFHCDLNFTLPLFRLKIFNSSPLLAFLLWCILVWPAALNNFIYAVSIFHPFFFCYSSNFRFTCKLIRVYISLCCYSVLFLIFCIFG
jgi:hypothetical protein